MLGKYIKGLPHKVILLLSCEKLRNQECQELSGTIPLTYVVIKSLSAWQMHKGPVSQSNIIT